MISKSSGFSLFELMISVALVAVVLAWGIPTFQALIRDIRLTTTVNELITAIQLTRSEAIKRSSRVTLCKSVDGSNCATSGGFEQGWIVFTDTNNNALRDDGEDLVRIHEAIPAHYGITLSGNRNVAQYLSFSPIGFSQMISGAFQAGTLTVCSAPEARQIVLSSVGRVRTVKATCL